MLRMRRVRMKNALSVFISEKMWGEVLDCPVGPRSKILGRVTQGVVAVPGRVARGSSNTCRVAGVGKDCDRVVNSPSTLSRAAGVGVDFSLPGRRGRGTSSLGRVTKVGVGVVRDGAAAADVPLILPGSGGPDTT